MKRPTNHVTRAIDAFREPHPPGLPVLSLEDITKLEEAFPPRCLSRVDTVEEHLRYAGKVELVEMLKAVHEKDDAESFKGAERAS